MFNGHPDHPIKLGEPSLIIGAAAEAAFETRSAYYPVG